MGLWLIGVPLHRTTIIMIKYFRVPNRYWIDNPFRGRRFIQVTVEIILDRHCWSDITKGLASVLLKVIAIGCWHWFYYTILWKRLQYNGLIKEMTDSNDKLIQLRKNSSFRLTLQKILNRYSNICPKPTQTICILISTWSSTLYPKLRLQFSTVHPSILSARV